MGVFAEPEQLVLNVSKYDKFIVIASDGVFEFITSHQVRCSTSSLLSAISGCACLGICDLCFSRHTAIIQLNGFRPYVSTVFHISR